MILAFCSYGLVLEWPQVHPALSLLHWYSIAGALAAAMASAGCMMLAWRRLLADLGSKLPVPVAARVTFMSQLGKYVPGAIWSLPRTLSLATITKFPGAGALPRSSSRWPWLVAVGLLIAAASLPLASPAAARRYLLFLAAIPVIAVCLAPPVLHRLLNFALKIIRQEPLEHPVSWRGLGTALAWTVVGWLLLGMQIWLLLADVAKDGVHSVLIVRRRVCPGLLACAAARGVPRRDRRREVILVAALAPVVPHGAALAVALVAGWLPRCLTWPGAGSHWPGPVRQVRPVRAAAASAATARGVQAGRHVGRHRKAPARRRRP